ncbi:MAG: hypothetical protein VX936_12135, partial [Planctomycetota bacterium]|nr:hypothetical protein [Planctomycetota bacterium]
MVTENELAPLARVQPNFYPTALQPNWISEGRLPVTPSLPRDFIDAKKRTHHVNWASYVQHGRRELY